MQAYLFINLFGFDYFQTYFAYFHLLQACWQPSCSTVDFCFNAARLKPELLSCDGVIDWCNCTTNDSNVLYYCSRADPFWVILEFHLAWVLDFCLGPKKWEFENFFEIGYPFTYCPRGFFGLRPQKYTNIDRNRTISARYLMLVFICNAI